MKLNKEQFKELKERRLGEINFNQYNEKMTIIEYSSAVNILVQFENGYLKNAEYQQFKKGNIKNPYTKVVLNIGYIGEGEYKPSINKKLTQQYDTWIHMLQRCYDEKQRNKYPTYKDCSVCKEWYNFQIFAQWYKDNYYEMEGEKMCLDKDILQKGNKTYSPETCIFVPQNINKLFTKTDALRGKYPIGVTWNKSNKKYMSQCNNGNGKQINLGYYDTPKTAFDVYKTYKEKIIKQIADKYKKYIPQKLYDAMYKYEVEITD
jgi:hypothetical protein